jgi:hypothetical protein
MEWVIKNFFYTLGLLWIVAGAVWVPTIVEILVIEEAFHEHECTLDTPSASTGLLLAFIAILWLLPLLLTLTSTLYIALLLRKKKHKIVPARLHQRIRSKRETDASLFKHHVNEQAKLTIIVLFFCGLYLPYSFVLVD